MVRQRLAWTPRTLPTVAASPQLLSVLQSSPCAHRVHKAATGMSPSPLATPITARRLSEPFRYPARLMRCDWGCAASAQAVVPFIQPPVMYGVFPSRSRQGGMQDRVCVCARVMCVIRLSTYTDCWMCAVCIHLSVRWFVPAGVQNWFTTVEKIIINWLMVKVCPGGLCLCVLAHGYASRLGWDHERSQCHIRFVVNKMLSCTTDGLKLSHSRVVQQGKMVCNHLLEESWQHCPCFPSAVIPWNLRDTDKTWFTCSWLIFSVSKSNWNHLK